MGITPIITNGGVSIARNVELEDEVEELGAMIVKEASSLADMNGGDGTTTATVLLKAITDKIFEMLRDNGSLVSKKVDTMKLKKQIDEECKKAITELRLQARPITPEDIYKVAIVSVEFDWLAKMITDIFQKIGVDGYVKIEEGVKTEYDILKGLEIPTGLS